MSMQASILFKSLFSVFVPQISYTLDRIRSTDIFMLTIKGNTIIIYQSENILINIALLTNIFSNGQLVKWHDPPDGSTGG